MASMSYVLFENTYSQLWDAYQKMDELHFDFKALSASEQQYFRKLVKLCDTISKDFLDEVNKIG